MASVRNLKKDINYLVSEIVAESYLAMGLFKDVKEEEVEPIIGEALDMRKEFISRANHPDGKDNPKLVKVHYQKLIEDLLNQVDELFDRLSEITKDKE